MEVFRLSFVLTAKAALNHGRFDDGSMMRSVVWPFEIKKINKSQSVASVLRSSFDVSSHIL
jgi:hypothetical protein